MGDSRVAGLGSTAGHLIFSWLIAASWQTSLSRLSVEIEGHALGGGMLKLEPTEAETVLVALPQLPTRAGVRIADELDSMMRSAHPELAQSRADQLILRDSIGLSQRDCRLLKEAADLLRARRYSRGAA